MTKEMVRAEPRNNCTADIDTNHSTIFTLLLELNVIREQRWTQFELQNSPSRAFLCETLVQRTNDANKVGQALF